MPFETMLNDMVDTPRSINSKADPRDTSLSIEDLIEEQPYDENVLGSSRIGPDSYRSNKMSRFSSRRNSRRDSMNITNRSGRRSDDGNIFKKSFMAKAIDTQN